MLFTEVIFVPFLLVTFSIFCCARKYPRLQLLTLLLASYIFYGWWNVKFLWLILFSTFLDFWMGHCIYKSQSLLTKRIFLCFSLAGNLGLLAYFKYANFFIDSLASVLTLTGTTHAITPLAIILPVGISFYTFQSMSYSLDIYFGKLKPHDSQSSYKRHYRIAKHRIA